jgi:cytochrome c oxidase subunit IV
MFDWMYVFLFVLAAVFFLASYLAAWKHKSGLVWFSLGATFMFAGFGLNIAGLRHTSTNGVHYSWATLPSVVYIAPLIVGLLLMVIGGPQIWRAYKEVKPKPSSTGEPSKPSRRDQRTGKRHSSTEDTAHPEMAASGAAV